MAKITFEDKVALNVNSDIADINKVNDSDMNEIKNVVNTNDDNTTSNTNNIADNTANIGNLANLNTTNKSNLVGAINSIVESGSNSNGEYVKYFDGTMICTKSLTGISGTLDMWVAPIYFKDIQCGSWAQNFTMLNCVTATTGSSQIWCTNYDFTNTSAGAVRVIAPNSNPKDYTINLTAIGKWK